MYAVYTENWGTIDGVTYVHKHIVYVSDTIEECQNYIYKVCENCEPETADIYGIDEYDNIYDYYIS